MSQPTRYTTKLLQSDKTGRLEVCPCYDGEWVAYSDYAALAAENANLKALQWETLKERNKAEAENERLRKAGDAMAKHYFDLYWIMNAESTSRHEPASITDWLAAKEGRDAK